MSVGLLAVCLLYRFYVRFHLSKWFTFSSLSRSFSCYRVVFYACTQRFAAWRRWRFNHKCSYEAHTSNLRKTVIRSTEPPLLPNRCYATALLFIEFGLLASWCVGLVALLQFWVCAVGLCELQMCHQKRWQILSVISIVCVSQHLVKCSFVELLFYSVLSIVLFAEFSR